MNGDSPPASVHERLGLLAVQAVPALLLAASLVFDLLTPNDITPTPVLAATPAVALGLFSLPGIAVTVAATVAVASTLLALHISQGRAVPAFFVEFASVLVVCATVLVLGAYKQRARHRFATLTTVAETAQRAVLPPAPRRVGQMPVSVSYRPARSEALVGGDAYAIEHTAHGVRLMIADVRGKGLGAIHTVAALTGAFRTAAYSEKSLEDIAEQLEYAFATDDDGPDAGESFATAVLVEIPDDQDRSASMINCGHPAPILLAEGTARLLEPCQPALPLGLGALTGTRTHASSEKVAVPPESTLVLYTDGVSEARDARGRFLDPLTTLDPDRNDPDTVTAALNDAVTRHTGGRLEDDTTVLAIQRPARASGPMN
jgi:serine phosphatase RsbU (regulator of sigma subunit)